jgi:serine/threonine protein kinase
VKPPNVLVFGESEDAIIAKVADFGFATIASNNNSRISTTPPWAAPEVGSRDGFTLEWAKKTDIYSFGMLCLWVLFKERLEEKMNAVAGKKYKGAPDIEILHRWNVADKLANTAQGNALQLVAELPSENLKDLVGRIFRDTLSVNAADRAEFSKISDYLRDRQV